MNRQLTWKQAMWRTPQAKEQHVHLPEEFPSAIIHEGAGSAGVAQNLIRTCISVGELVAFIKASAVKAVFFNLLEIF